MESDYQILYEILKEKTIQFEKLWKSALIELKEDKKGAKPYSSRIETQLNCNEIGRNSFGRRINPTLLKTEPTRFESAENNPFLCEADKKEFPLNRPVGKYGNESVWKKLPVPSVAKVSERVENDFGSAKMEYAVYLKQGISANQTELLKQLSAAFYQIVFEEVTIDSCPFGECFGIILRILRVGNELFGLKSFSKIISEKFLLFSIPKMTAQMTMNKPSFRVSSNIFDSPIELFLFSAYWIQGARDRIVQLLPDSMKCFEKNLLLDVVDPSLCQFFKNNFKKEEYPVNSSGTGLSLQSLLPVAYSSQRDSKNFFRDPTSHANQQKLRDLFINLIRHFSTNQLDTSHPNFHRSFGSRVSELMAKVNSENFTWLAQLYIQEYEQAADVRLDRFEDRMVSRKSITTTGNASSACTTFSLDQIFFIFLQYADSYRLTRIVEKKVITMISASLEQANNLHKRSLWSECIRRLRSMIKLLAFCRYKMSEILCAEDEKCDDFILVEEEDVIIYYWTEDAILKRQVLTLLPLIYEYFTFIGPEAIKSRCSNTAKLLLRYYQVKFGCKRGSSTGQRAKLLLKLCLEDIFRETFNSEFYSDCLMSMKEGLSCKEEEEKRISKSKSQEKEILVKSSIDEDDNQLPPLISNVFRSISSQIRSIYVQLNSICITAAFPTDSENGPGSSSNHHDSLATRKVRPVTQVPAEDLKQQKIQKQLRQWFWWRYGSQKDLIDALNSYILEQVLFPQFPLISSDRTHSAEMCKQMYRNLIYKVLPELLPNFWKDQPELVEIIINLSLEMAEKSINYYFS